MLASKIGDELAVRLSAEDVARLGLKEGDELIVARSSEPMTSAPVAESRPSRITDPEERRLALERLRHLRGMMPADFKFNREEANER